MNFSYKESFAHKMDEQDSLKKFRNKFHIPPAHQRDQSIYFCGNSLGLQPKNAEKYINMIKMNKNLIKMEKNLIKMNKNC